MKKTGHLRHKKILKARGWTNRTACRHLGYAKSHFSAVLNGHRKSKTLLTKIEGIEDKKGGEA